MQRPDVLVIGGGVFGLSVAEAAVRAGLSVTLAEAGQVGVGASGGPVGALVPFGPRSTAPMRSLQLAGLAGLPAMAERLRLTTGRDPGYRRTGRLTPLLDDAALRRARADIAAVGESWPADAHLRLLKGSPDAHWLDPAAAPCGVLADDLSARVTPLLWLAALRAAVGDRIEIREGWRAVGPESNGHVRFDRGTLYAGHTVVAAGAASFALLAPMIGTAGHTVAGQAALLDAAPPPAPVILERGLWIVPHGRGVGIGSTRQRNGNGIPDDRLDRLISRARTLSPALRNAPVVRRWTGLRPVGRNRRPLVGPLAGAPRLIAATGGGGIGFAVAHLVAEAVVSHICGRPPPPAFDRMVLDPIPHSGDAGNAL